MAIFRPYLCWELFVVLSLAAYRLGSSDVEEGDACRSERAIDDLLAMSGSWRFSLWVIL